MKKILLVEDNKEIHDLIKNALEKERYIVKNAYSGTEALIILEKENVDIILLDLMLPGINGEEIIKKINQKKEYKKRLKEITNKIKEGE